MKLLSLALFALSCHSGLFVAAAFAQEECRFVGRLVGVDGRAVAGAELQAWYRVETEASSSMYGSPLRTDDDGRFEYALGPEEGQQSLELTIPVAGSDKFAQAVVDLSARFASGDVELGDVRCYVPDSPTRWDGFDRAELEAEYARWNRLGYGREIEGILREMGTRGGDAVVAFLEEELAKLSADDLEWEPWEDILVVTRALVMARGGADPLQLELDVEPEVVCTFPELPALQWRLVNGHAERTLVVADGGSYRSGRFARVRAHVRDSQGREYPPLRMGSGFGGGMYQHTPLAPGASLRGGTELARYVEPLPPGRYTVTLHYHDGTDIDTDPTFRAYMTVASKPFTLVVKPLEVRLKRAAYEASVAAVRALDTAKPVPLTSATWTPTMQFDERHSAPEDRLFRFGWNALPALLGVLDEDGVELDRADWISGLCFDITGLCAPGNLGMIPLGRYEWTERWPGTDAAPARRYGEWNVATHPASDEQRRAYHERWRALRSAVKLVLEE